MSWSYILTPLLMSLVPLHTKLNNTEKPKGRELCPSLLLDLTLFKDPQTQLLDHKLHHLHDQIPQMAKTHLKETLSNRKIEGDVFGVKDYGTLLLNAQTKEFSPWLNFKLPLRGLMERMNKRKSKTRMSL